MRVIVTFGLELGLESPLQCIGIQGYVTRLIFYTLVPVGLVLGILLLAACYISAQRRHRAVNRFRKGATYEVPSVLQVATPPSLAVIFILYPLVTNVAFAAFMCHEFGTDPVGSEGAFLKADVSIVCYSARHRAVQ